MTFLSTVFDEAEIGSGAFAAQCRGRRMLVVTGLQDDRVPPDHVVANASQMRKAGADVTVRLLDDADHFLLFSHRAEVLAMMEQWLGMAEVAN